MSHSRIEQTFIVQPQQFPQITPIDSANIRNPANGRLSPKPKDEDNGTMAVIDDIHHTARPMKAAKAEMGLIGRIRDNLARRALYRRTVAELRQLSDRELGDLGLNRSMITRIAYEAAWGK